MNWPRAKKCRGVIFQKEGNFHHGISGEGLHCYLRESTFPNVIGATGYVVVPSILMKNKGKNLLTTGDELMTLQTDSTLTKTTSITELFENMRGPDIIGGITYNRNNLLGKNVGDDVAVLGFDTSHAKSPRLASLEYMADQVLKLSKWAYSIATDIEFPKAEWNLPRNTDEDYLSWVLREINIEARKLPLPKENEYPNPIDYLVEVLRRIECGVQLNEELTQEDELLNKEIQNEEMQQLGMAMRSLMSTMRDLESESESE